MLRFALFSILLSLGATPAWAGMIRPDGATASSEFTGGFDGRAVNTINGSGLPGGFTVGSAHAAYASGNHWTNSATPPINQFITWSFNQPKTLSAIYLWNHQSSAVSDNPGYDVTRFDLRALDVNGVELLLLTNVVLSPDTPTGQTINFGSAIAGVKSVRLTVKAVQSSTTYTGLGEVAFEETITAARASEKVPTLPVPFELAIATMLAAIAWRQMRRP